MGAIERIGDATLYCGDCLDILPGLSGKELDALITDMPFGCTECEWDVKIDLNAYWPLARAAVKLNAAHCHYCQMPFAGELWRSNQKEFRYDLVCKKHTATGYLDANRKPMRGHETIFVFYRRLPTYNPQKTAGKPFAIIRDGYSACYGTARISTVNRSGDRYPTSLIPYVKDRQQNHEHRKSRPLHNTQKNINTTAWLIRSYSNPGDAVLDPFMGSGTTGVAAIQNGRKFIGIEKDPHWFDVACRRIEAAWMETRQQEEVAS